MKNITFIKFDVPQYIKNGSLKNSISYLMVLAFLLFSITNSQGKNMVTKPSDLFYTISVFASDTTKMQKDGGMDMIHDGMAMTKLGKDMMDKGEASKNKDKMQRGMKLMDEGMDMMKMGKEMMQKEKTAMSSKPMPDDMDMMDKGMDMMDKGKGMADKAMKPTDKPMKDDNMMGMGMKMMDKGMGMMDMCCGDKMKKMDKMKMNKMKKAKAPMPMKDDNK